ncbi:RsmD family RNA methyltransferase [Deinococcus radiophilus]|uniref:N-6 DNA methylase n=1 Tax=Deinococcus radiophilus TaxID=32062 RepID=A0A3S0IMR4_9DEIO|nr:RsmD family RNA methyltransferase [Deinococcus radiophilus]RTR27529.1 N-6 DNA methylase [Deinococcus radiophilus]UFA50402.1 RsmD family RNA methyltransferase [Deinococcus radiophilus]
MSLRILGGVAKGRPLKVPESARPSGARIRKSLFDLLHSRRPPGGTQPVTFVDLHGGSGAIGLEAASRGYRVTLIEKEGRSVKALEQNARDLDLWREVRIIKGDAAGQIGRLPPADIVFSDPPYEQDIPALIEQILQSTALAPGGLLIAQHERRVKPPQVPGFDLDTRYYGSNALSLYTRSESGAAEDRAAT